MPEKKKALKKQTARNISAKNRPAKKTAAKAKKKIIRKKKSTAPTPRMLQNKKEALRLEKSEHNPIIAPIGEHAWESGQTFNPTAVRMDGKIHLVYRSIGDDGISRFGYAASYDGEHVHERYPHPVFSLLLNTEESQHRIYASGGSWGGAEDPRITLHDGKLYMLFTAIDEGGFPRVAMTSIAKDDFLEKKWIWDESKIISPPGEVHKNWVLFPEKINGKYAILHSISPDIAIEYLDDLDFRETSHIKSVFKPAPVRDGWEKSMRGIGPAPIKTKYGWLVLYHASSERNGYAVGAMLLDADHPENIIARSKEPILEADAWYENYGWKGGIVYSCGAAVMGDNLLVYYGGADSVGCVAKVNLEKFLKDLVGAHAPKVAHTVKTQKRIS